MDSQLCDDHGHLFLAGDHQQVGGVAGLEPELELFHAVNGLVEIGDDLAYELLEFFDCVDVGRVAVGPRSRRVLHLLSGVVDELSRGVVPHDCVVIFGPSHLLTDRSLP